jgi:hypothetical protein
MKYDIVNYSIWILGITSLVLTVFGAIKKSVYLLLIAAFPLLVAYMIIWFAFGIEGILVSGIYCLLLTCIQIALIVGYMLKVGVLGWILLSTAAVLIWINILAIIGNPFGY